MPIPRIKLIGLAIVLIVAVTPLFQAFEAHVINVTAELVQIDPPVMTPPGPLAWDNPNGGTDLINPVTVFVVEMDDDATHIYYTFGAGSDPSLVADPVCGDTLGGIKSGVYSVDVSADTVIKAVACDGDTNAAQHSVINVKVFTFAPLPDEPVIEEESIIEGATTENIEMPTDTDVVEEEKAVIEESITQ